MSMLRDLSRWCRRYLVPRTIRNWYVLRKWIRGNPLREGFLFDLREIPTKELRIHVLGLLVRIANDQATAQRPVNLTFILAEDGFSCISDLYSLVSLLPPLNFGNIEFYRSLEDCRNHHDDLVQGLYKFGSFSIEGNSGDSIGAFQNLVWRVEPSAYYLNQARSLLKMFGHDHSIYFCDLTHLQDEVLPESWNQFFAKSLSTDNQVIFIVLTPPQMREEKFVHVNVFYIKALGLSLLDQLALVHLSDGFIGPFDVLASMALQRSHQAILVANNLRRPPRGEPISIVSKDATSREIQQSFAEIRGKLNVQPIHSIEPQPSALV